MVIEPAPHRDWMTPAVLACLCCFWPTGICAIMSASKVIVSSVYVCLHVTKENKISQRGIAINLTKFFLFFIRLLPVSKYLHVFVFKG